MKSRICAINKLSTGSGMSTILTALVGVPVLMASLLVPAEGQDFTDWSAPVNLGRAVNSKAFDGCPSITAKGKEMLYMSGRPGGSGQLDMYVSLRATGDSPWEAPVWLGPDVNSAADEGCPVLFEEYLFFQSTRPSGCGNSDLYVAYRVDPNSLTDWSVPVNLGCEVNSTGPEFSPSLFRDDDGTVYLYFSSGLRPGGMGFGDVYFSVLQPDGSFGQVSPVLEFNTAFNDLRPGIRVRDGLELFFDSNRPGSIANSQDLYSSERACILCSWTTPKNLGPTVNSSAVDGGAKLSPDGTELYFMSNRADTVGDQDIYVSVRRRIIR